MTRVSSSGWTVHVTHPSSNRTVSPDVLDDPAILPSLNSLPQIRIPVRKSDTWLDPSWENNPDNATLDVWLDGIKQPIDELQEVEDRTDRTVLVGVGGTELRQRASIEERDTRRHIAAQNLITSETTYSEDVDTPSVSTVTGRTVQNPTTTAEFDEAVDYGDTDPVDTSGDELTVHDTSFTDEAESGSLSGADTLVADRFSGDEGGDRGGAVRFDADNESVEITFTLGYTMPAEDFNLAVRWDDDGDWVAQDNTITWELDGEQISTFGAAGTAISWSDLDNLGELTQPSSDLSSGSHTLTVTADSVTAGQEWYLDVVQPHDTGDRYTFGPFNYTYDNSVTNPGDGGAYLDNPGLKPQNGFEVMGSDYLSAFSIVGANPTLTIDDTTGDQYLQVSNDRGSNWSPTNGDEDNTNSVDVTFGSGGSTVRLRVNLDSISPNGSRNETPRENYDSQTVSDWDLKADIDEELLLIDYSDDKSVEDHLNDIATNRFLWSANLDANGDYQVSWAEPGQRTAGDDPDIGNVSIKKVVDVYDRISIFGSSDRVTGFEFTASSTFVSVTDETSPPDIVPGSESVYDDSGNTFTRDVDYEIDYTDNEVRTLDGGSMTDGDTFNIDYDHEVEGTYPSKDDVPSPDREFVGRVPGVTSPRAAEQIAFALFDGEAENPLYEGDLSIPQAEVGFDPMDAFNLDNLDLPSEATPLEIRGEPSVTPAGIEVRLGSRSPVEESLRSIRETVSQLSRQT